MNPILNVLASDTAKTVTEAATKEALLDVGKSAATEVGKAASHKEINRKSISEE